MPSADGSLLFVDLDDVLADFTGWCVVQFDQTPSRLGQDRLWERVHAHPTFFRDMPPAPGALAFWKRIQHLSPTILTACSETEYVSGATQKREWVREHLGWGVRMLPCKGGKYKQLFMHSPGDVLIDDFRLNIDRWNAAGGRGILHVPHDFDQTFKRLTLALPEAA
jgi:hypothetical protein